jgi:serpin B
MKRRDLLWMSLGLGAVLSGCASGVSPSGTATPLPQPPAGADIGPSGSTGSFAAFSDGLMRQLAPTPANVVFSPWSIATVLAMVREGAAGATAAELAAALGAPPPGLNELAVRTGTAQLHAGNALWGQRDLSWKQAFVDRLAAAYAAPLHQADFRTAYESVRSEINAWVDGQTAGKIPQLLTPGLLTPDTRLVLVNAVHFKAPWAEPLNELGARPFTTAGGGTVNVPSLAGTSFRPWWTAPGLTGSAVFCEGNEYALVVVLPKDAKTPVPAAAFAEVLAADPTSVAIQLPAWKLRLRAELSPLLQKLGIRLAFDPDRADFSGMTAAERLFLDFVVHEAVVEVNAKGIEAAAATAAGMAGAGAPVEPKSLVLDRPFHWALMHVPTATSLFLGQVADPTRETAG